MTIQESPVTTRPLYDRLGGATAIAAIVDDVIAAHLANPVVGPRFQAVKDLDHLRRMATDFFCAGAGGPQKYVGKDMRAAHKGMNVNDQEFDAVVDDIMTVLGRHAIDPRTQADVLGILNSFKGEILHG